MDCESLCLDFLYPFISKSAWHSLNIFKETLNAPKCHPGQLMREAVGNSDPLVVMGADQCVFCGAR